MNHIVSRTRPLLPLKPEWALFERMRLVAQRDVLPSVRSKGSHVFPRAEANVSVRIIPTEEFTAERLLKEIANLPETGGEVHLPPGCIELGEELRLKSGVRIVGVPGLTELVFKNTDYGITLRGTESPIAGVQVENLRIRHQGPHKFGAAIFATKATDLRFSRVEVIAPRALGFLLSDGVHRAHLDWCIVSDAMLGGFMLVRDVRDTTLHSCIAERCHQSGIFLTDLKLPLGMDPLNFDAQIHHTIEVIKNFGPFSPDDPVPYRNSLINCTFRGNRKMGVTTDGVGYLRIENCIIAENDCEGITIDNGSWNFQVQNCHIYGNGWRGLQHSIELTGDFVEKMGLMEDGSSKAKLPGVSLDNAAYSRIENNCIEGNWGDGVKFVRSVYSCTVARNMIANNNKGDNSKFHFFGVLVGVASRQHTEQSDFPSCHNRIMENDILGPHFAGVHLMPHTTGNVVQNNRIVGTTFTPIEDHTISGNVIENNNTENTF